MVADVLGEDHGNVLELQRLGYIGVGSEELLKKLIYEHWQSLKPRKTLLQRRGGHPQHLLENAPPNLSLRENRKKVVAEYIQNHHQQHHS